MMKEADLPVGLGVLELPGDPIELLAVHIITVQRKEFRLADFEAVVTLSSHVERLVEALIRTVVIAKGSVELHAGIEKRLVRILEFGFEVGGRVAAIDVIAEHEDEVKGELIAVTQHMAGDLVLSRRAGSTVAYDGEANGPGLERQVEIGGRNGGGRKQRGKQKGGNRTGHGKPRG